MYSHNTDEGPSYSSQHSGADVQFFQNWRNSTDSWMGAVDWKPVRKTTLTFEENVTHYKGNTDWQLTGLNLQLANGTPVTLGFDNVTVPLAAGRSSAHRYQLHHSTHRQPHLQRIPSVLPYGSHSHPDANRTIPLPEFQY